MQSPPSLPPPSKKNRNVHMVAHGRIRRVAGSRLHLVSNEIEPWCTFQKFGGLSGSEDRGGGDNSIQFINFGRVGDKIFKEWQQKIGGWKDE